MMQLDTGIEILEYNCQCMAQTPWRRTLEAHLGGAPWSRTRPHEVALGTFGAGTSSI
jgi:hypothetical protein